MKIFSKRILEKNSCFLFKFSGINVDVGLGIADTVNLKRRILYSSRGNLYGLGQFNLGEGFKVDEEVIMLVNLSLGQI